MLDLGFIVIPWFPDGTAGQSRPASGACTTASRALPFFDTFGADWNVFPGNARFIVVRPEGDGTHASAKT